MTLGAMALTRIVYGATSMAKLFARPRTPTFGVEYVAEGTAPIAYKARIGESMDRYDD